MLGRRELLGGALGLLALTACDVDDLRPPEDDATPSTGGTPSGTATAEADPDATLVDRVVTDIVGAAIAVEGARLLPRLRRPLGRLGRTHVAHLVALDAGPDGLPTEAPASFAAGLELVRTTETALQQSLVAAAVEARSGALARLLASMSAAVAQELALLPTGPAPEGAP